MKLFISIPVPPAVTAELLRLQRTLEALHAFKGSYVNLANFHCTIFFIGLVEKEKAPLIKERFLDLSFPSFELGLSTLEVNSLCHPHVLWVSLKSEVLSPCAHYLAEAFPEYATSRPFKGHITLARIKKLLSDNQFLCIPVEPIQWRVEELHLQESFNTQEGVYYRSLASIKLSS